MPKYDDAKILEALCTLHLKRGDILIADATSIDIDDLVHLRIPDVDFEIPIVAVVPCQGDTIAEALRSCDLALLKEVVASMEAENAKEQIPTPGT